MQKTYNFSVIAAIIAVAAASLAVCLILFQPSETPDVDTRLSGYAPDSFYGMLDGELPTPYDAVKIIYRHRPDARNIRYTGEVTIDGAACYEFVILIEGTGRERIAVSKEYDVFYSRHDGGWDTAAGGLPALEWARTLSADGITMLEAVGTPGGLTGRYAYILDFEAFARLLNNLNATETMASEKTGRSLTFFITAGNQERRTVSLAGENYLTIDGYGFKADRDWFASVFDIYTPRLDSRVPDGFVFPMLYGTEMTPDDVLTLASAGDELRMEDFAGFRRFDAIMLSSVMPAPDTVRQMDFSIEGGLYTLTVRAKSTGKPDSVILRRSGEDGGADIRSADAEELISAFFSGM
jgi:hypothetical protein